MRTINLIIVPGTGKTQVQIDAGTTWQQFINQNPAIRGRDLIANGRGVATTDYHMVIPSNINDVFATAPVKGNC